MFGLKPSQVDEGGKILRLLARDWRELLAGSEGFLTDEKRRSLFRHNVVWGEQVGWSSIAIEIKEDWLMEFFFSCRLGCHGKLKHSLSEAESLFIWTSTDAQYRVRTVQSIIMF